MPKIEINPCVRGVVETFRCGMCGNEYRTRDEADACRTTPWIPKDTRYMVEAQARHGIWTVRTVEGGCCQAVSMEPHKLFKAGMGAAVRGIGSGVCLLTQKPDAVDYSRKRPLTLAMAEEAAKECAAEAKAAEKRAKEYAAKAKFFEGFIAEERAAGRAPSAADAAIGHKL